VHGNFVLPLYTIRRLCKREQIICATAFNGKAHDCTIFKETLRIKPSIQVLADSGYRGAHKVHSNTLYPLKHKEDIKNLNEQQLKEQKIRNRQISSKRMKIEHIIARVKRFNILSLQYRNRRKRFGLRLNLICGIVNYDNPLKLAVS